MSIPQQFMSIISPYPIKAVDIMTNKMCIRDSLISLQSLLNWMDSALMIYLRLREENFLIELLE